MNNPTPGLIEQVRIIAKELEDLSKVEEQFFRQKSRIQFIKGVFSDSLGSVDGNVEVFSDDLLREILGIEFPIDF
ncbi:hypothetical protein V6N13_000577 [Hibiscus sabdariffa]